MHLVCYPKSQKKLCLSRRIGSNMYKCWISYSSLGFSFKMWLVEEPLCIRNVGSRAREGREEKKGVVSGTSYRRAVEGAFLSLMQREAKAMCVKSRAGWMPQPQNHRMQCLRGFPGEAGLRGGSWGTGMTTPLFSLPRVKQSLEKCDKESYK